MRLTAKKVFPKAILKPDEAIYNNYFAI